MEFSQHIIQLKKRCQRATASGCWVGKAYEHSVYTPLPSLRLCLNRNMWCERKQSEQIPYSSSTVHIRQRGMASQKRSGIHACATARSQRSNAAPRGFQSLDSDRLVFISTNRRDGDRLRIGPWSELRPIGLGEWANGATDPSVAGRGGNEVGV